MLNTLLAATWITAGCAPSYLCCPGLSLIAPSLMPQVPRHRAMILGAVPRLATYGVPRPFTSHSAFLRFTAATRMSHKPAPTDDMDLHGMKKWHAAIAIFDRWTHVAQYPDIKHTLTHQISASTGQRRQGARQPLPCRDAKYTAKNEDTVQRCSGPDTLNAHGIHVPLS